MSRHHLSQIIAVLFLLLSTTLCAQNKKLVFTPQWLPQAQFAGYYVALEKGFYSELNLDVVIQHPPANVPAQNFLADGKADIVSLFLVTAMKERMRGTSIVNIAQMSEHSSIVFVARKSSGIETLYDFESRKVGVWKSGFEEVPKALLAAKNIDVNWIPILSSVNLFLSGGIDLMTVMWYNEYNQIYLCGIDEEDLSSFFLKDYGYDIPEDGLYVTEETYLNRKDDLKAFVQGTIKGWKYVAENREEALEIVIKQMKRARIPASEAHQRWMLEKILEVQGFEGGGTKNLILTEESFSRTLEVINADVKSDNYQLIWSDFSKPVVKTFNLSSK